MTDQDWNSLKVGNRVSAHGFKGRVSYIDDIELRIMWSDKTESTFHKESGKLMSEYERQIRISNLFEPIRITK